MILVAGSTGFVGGMITRQLLELRQEVRILVRPASDYRPLVEAGAQPVLGDLKQPETLEAACREVDAVITTASSGQRGGADNAQTVDLEGNRNLIDAARAAGVRQLVFVSLLSASEDSPIPLPRAKARTEAYLRDSGVPCTILAANGIMDVMFPLVIDGPLSAERPVTLVGEGKRRHSYVAARDLAAFGVAAVRRPAALNEYVRVGGPAAVSGAMWSPHTNGSCKDPSRSAPFSPVSFCRTSQPCQGWPSWSADSWLHSRPSIQPSTWKQPRRRSACR